MPNTYSQIFIHLVFAVKYRNSLIAPDAAERIHSYMASVINNTNKCKAIKVGGVSDHVHLLVRLSTSTDVADLVKSVKVATTLFINTEVMPGGNFAWQEGFGAFSISATHTDALVAYIQRQPEHHLAVSFIDEYEDLLRRNKVDYNKSFIFGNIE